MIKVFLLEAFIIIYFPIRSIFKILVLLKMFFISGFISNFQVIAIVNFPKKQIANFMSECLVLGVVQGDSVVLITPNNKIGNGLKIA